MRASPNPTLLLLVAGVIGCGSSSKDKSDAGAGGSGGTTTVLTGGGGAGGGAAGGRGGGAAGSGGGAGASADAGVEVGPGAANLGKACAADTDCGPGLQCLKATDSVLAGGGPAHGLCSAPCATNADCAASAGVCVDYRLAATDPPASYCFQPCTVGDGNAKCHSRTEVGCVGFQSGQAACLPTCSQDSDCPTGRHCHPQTNVCVDAAAAGDRMGAHCVANADAGTSNCAGVCLTIGTTATICSTRCVLGTLQGCNWVNQTMSVTGGTHGVCALGPAGSGVGDVGFCSVECDNASDCPDQVDPGPICDTTQQSVVGHGICSWNPGAADGGRG